MKKSEFSKFSSTNCRQIIKCKVVLEGKMQESRESVGNLCYKIYLTIFNFKSKNVD